MTIYEITLPWQDRILHANQRLHWAENAKRVKRVREHVTIMARLRRYPIMVAHADVTLTWHPPKAYQTDADNLAPLLKACLDGLVRGKGATRGYGLTADDTPQYITSRCVIGEVRKPGQLILTIEVTE